MHYQINPMPQSKLIRCIKGEIFDIAVDIRRFKNICGWSDIKKKIETVMAP